MPPFTLSHGEYEVSIFYTPDWPKGGWWTAVATNAQHETTSGGLTFEEAMSGLDEAIRDALAHKR